MHASSLALYAHGDDVRHGDGSHGRDSVRHDDGPHGRDGVRHGDDRHDDLHADIPYHDHDFHVHDLK